MAEINNYLDYINFSVTNNSKDLIEKTENRYSSIIQSIAKRIANSHGHTAIMLSGPSASGKTTTAFKIADELKALGIAAYTISLDDFYMNKCDAMLLEDGTPDLESVHALDLEFINRTLNKLIVEGESDLPIFDFTIGRRSDKTKHIKLNEDDVIIVEGLHALNPLITECLPKDSLLKLYINVSSRIYGKNRRIILNKRNLRFSRRLVRDYQFRSSSVENTYMLWQTVLRGEELYLSPYKAYADLRINSIHIYEPCVLKQIVIPLLESEMNNDGFAYRKEAKKLIRGLKSFEDIDLSLVPSDSLLREFLGENV
ncbi:MAG TPA: nucleoside kinase [Clostridia bacterium]|nr:nucleoside kinase [Clostridia bacterium]